MLNFRENSRWGRRSFLQAGSLALGGLTLPTLLSAKAAAAAAEVSKLVRDKSVIFLFMHGGPSQIETFDPKMDAPSGIRSTTGEVKTKIPGVTFGGTFSRLAERADRLSIVRSFRSGTGNHDIKPIVHESNLNANMGSLYARIAGTNSPVTGLPTNAAIFPRSVDPSTKERISNFGKFESTGELGKAYAPFIPGAGGDLQKNMELNMSRSRLDDRRNLLAGLDRIKRHMDATGALDGMDHFQQQAFSTIIGGAATAFDLSQEDPKTIARYDTSQIARPDNISRKWNNYSRYVDNGKSLGKLCLLARRLCEAGVGYVTVTTNFVWDMHADANNAGCEEGMQYMGLPFDHAVSALIDDLEARGLSDKVLLVATGEMGRTPKLSVQGGRGHWGASTPLLIYGGGLRTGQVIGHSTKDAGAPLSEPYDIPNLTATIMHTLLDIGLLRITTGIPADVARVLTSHDPIPGLL